MNHGTTLKVVRGKEPTEITLEKSVLTGYCKNKGKKNCTETLYSPVN